MASKNKTPETEPELVEHEEEILEDAPLMSEISGVYYTGRADVKILTVADLMGAGIEDAKQDLVFNSDNGWFIPVASFNAATRDWLAGQSTDFILE